MPPSMVNSISCMSAIVVFQRLWRSLQTACKLPAWSFAARRWAAVYGYRQQRPRPVHSSDIRRYSLFSPVAGSLVNATPVPQSSPMFPNTMDCTLTAVPQLPGMSFKRRYTIARGLSQERNTAFDGFHQLLLCILREVYAHFLLVKLLCI